MASGFLSVLPLTALWDGAPFSDDNAPAPINQTIYTDPTSPETSMQLDVWRSLEGHLSILNEHDISVQFFQGFNAQGPGGLPWAQSIQWSFLSHKTKRWWVSYVLARLAPFANIGGFQYSWESPGNSTENPASDPSDCGQGSRCGDYELALLLQEMDPFNHSTTYEAMNVTVSNHFDLPGWTFASVEALGDGDARLCGGKYKQNMSCIGGSTQQHHDVCLQGYKGKPVYMCEGHDLWKSWWQAKEPNVVRAAWAVTTAAASFTWADLGNAPDDPYYTNQTFEVYAAGAKAIDVLTHIMTKEVKAFYRLVPADDLLLAPVPAVTFCLAEKGAQYVVYSDAGEPFSLDIGNGEVKRNRFSLSWFDPASGKKIDGGVVEQLKHRSSVKLHPPSVGANTHWVALLLAL